jgi:hypothetical protein
MASNFSFIQVNFSLNTKIVNAIIHKDLLTVFLNDGRIIIFPTTNMKWLKQATEEQQQDFSIESDGYGIWWDELDDGIALHHLLSTTVISGEQRSLVSASHSGD